MDHIAVDVHKRESQLCILAEGGELIERWIRTEPERVTAVLGNPQGLDTASRFTESPSRKPRPGTDSSRQTVVRLTEIR